jgi:hypothetical protein
MSLRLIALFLLGCSASAPAPTAPRGAEVPQARTNPTAPVVASIEVVEGEPLAGTRLKLRANLAQQGHWPYPVAVEWTLPRGVFLVGGSQASVVALGEPQVIELELAAIPAEDLVVTASSTGPDAGFHARAVYRFGRPEPAPEGGPDRTGPATHMNGHDLGPSVPMN